MPQYSDRYDIVIYTHITMKLSHNFGQKTCYQFNAVNIIMYILYICWYKKAANSKVMYSQRVTWYLNIAFLSKHTARPASKYNIMSQTSWSPSNSHVLKTIHLLSADMHCKYNKSKIHEIISPTTHEWLWQQDMK